MQCIDRENKKTNRSRRYENGVTRLDYIYQRIEIDTNRL